MHKFLLLLFLGVTFVSPAHAGKSVDVVVTLKPVYGLVAAIMGDTGKPLLLLNGKYSPHQTSLTPSMVRRTQDADIVFWIGPSLEPYMGKLLGGMTDKDRSAPLETSPGIEFLPAREGGNWRHNGGMETESDHGHGRHDDAIDPHFWLSVENAKRMSDFIESRLSEKTPEAAHIYGANRDKLIEKLTATKERIKQQLAPVQHQPFYVFHDAYQYFERDYDLNVLGAVTIDPDRQPGAGRIREIRRTIRISKAVCLFREPQFQSRFIGTIEEGLDIRIGVLDPMGGTIAAGEDSYIEILEQMADAVAGCL